MSVLRELLRDLRGFFEEICGNDCWESVFMGVIARNIGLEDFTEEIACVFHIFRKIHVCVWVI